MLTDTGQVIVVDKHPKQSVMEIIPLGKGRSSARETSQPLTEHIKPTRDMVGLPFILADHAVALRVEAVGIGLPAVTKRGTANVGKGQASLELSCPGFAAIP
jgi:hypothetical protein